MNAPFFEQRHFALRWADLVVVVLIGLVFAGIMLQQVYFPYGTIIEKKRVLCIVNVKQILIASEIYASDNDAHLPSWFITDLECNPGTLRCPLYVHAHFSSHTPPPSVTYGFNDAVRGLDTSTLTVDPAAVVLVADGGDAQHFLRTAADIDVTAHGARSATITVGYLDGHVENVPVREAPKIILDPARLAKLPTPAP